MLTTLIQSQIAALEEGATRAYIVDDAPVIVYASGEEVVALPLEEPAGAAWVPTNDDPPLLSRGDEDFSGSLPADEWGGSLASTWLLPDASSWVGAVGEDIVAQPAVAPGEETASGSWTAIELAAPAPSPPEDFAGSLPIEEPGAWAWAPLEQLARDAGAPVIGEDFGGVHPTEEASPWPMSLESNWVSAWFAPEDFAGSLPLEEGMPTWADLAVATPGSSWWSVGEDFGGVHPTEEVFLVALVVEPAWTPASAGIEDYQGALPLEEPADAAAALLGSSEPARVVDSVAEEFGGAHPSEEIFLVSVVVEPAWVSETLGIEDYQGALPVEEAGAGAMLGAPEPARAVDVNAEEFGGAHPSEEVGAQWTPSAEPVWIGAPIGGEEFAGSLAAEEPAEVARCAPEIFATTALSFEDFAGSLAAEELGQSAWIATDSLAPVSLSSEDFAGSLPIDEAGAWLLDGRTEWLGVTFGEEHFEGALPLEELGSVQWLDVERPAANALGVGAADEPLPPTPPPPPKPPQGFPGGGWVPPVGTPSAQDVAEDFAEGERRRRWPGGPLIEREPDDPRVIIVERDVHVHGPAGQTIVVTEPAPATHVWCATCGAENMDPEVELDGWTCGACGQPSLVRVQGTAPVVQSMPVVGDGVDVVAVAAGAVIGAAIAGPVGAAVGALLAVVFGSRKR